MIKETALVRKYSSVFSVRGLGGFVVGEGIPTPIFIREAIGHGVQVFFVTLHFFQEPADFFIREQVVEIALFIRKHCVEVNFLLWKREFTLWNKYFFLVHFNFVV